MAVELEAMQSSVKDSLRATNKQQTLQSAKNGCYGISPRRREGFIPSTPTSHGSAND